jgi:hypothetical protein
VRIRESEDPRLPPKSNYPAAEAKPVNHPATMKAGKPTIQTISTIKTIS